MCQSDTNSESVQTHADILPYVLIGLPLHIGKINTVNPNYFVASMFLLNFYRQKKQGCLDVRSSSCQQVS